MRGVRVSELGHCGDHFSQDPNAPHQLVLGIYRMSQDKKGISALPLSKEIGVSYPTAWLMQHKIRKAMADRDQGSPLQDRIEVDEG